MGSRPWLEGCQSGDVIKLTSCYCNLLIGKHHASSFTKGGSYFEVYLYVYLMRHERAVLFVYLSRQLFIIDTLFIG